VVSASGVLYGLFKPEIAELSEDDGGPFGGKLKGQWLEYNDAMHEFLMFE